MTSPQDLDESFREAVAALGAPAARRSAAGPVRDGATLRGERARELFEAQVVSRHLDLAARWLHSFGEGFHTVASAGHEGNAALAAVLRPTDPALLHYRSGGFYCVRVAQAAAADAAFAAGAGAGAGTDDDATPTGDLSPLDPLSITGTPGPQPSDAPPSVEADDPVTRVARDVLRAVVASAQDPATGGRRKLFGNLPLAVVPTTGAVAAHLPRAVGLGLAVERVRRVTGDRPHTRSASDSPRWPADAIVLCSFGDASVNHADAVAAFHTAGWCDHTGLRIPVLFVCEDNGLGGSVRSPDGWVAATLRAKPGLRYFAADGCDLAETYDVAGEAVAWVRRQRRPAVLHLSTVRLLGHAGDADEETYRTAGEIATDLARDPLVTSARLLVAAGIASAEELLTRYDELGWQIRKVAEEVLGEPKLTAAAEIVAPLAPRRPIRVARAVTEVGAAATGPGMAARSAVFDAGKPEERGPLTLAETINAALTDAMLDHPTMVVFGPEVARRGGAHGITAGLRERFGASRVFDTPADGTSLLGLGLGLGPGGLLPVPELPHLGDLYRAVEQLRGEAATAQFHSRGAFRNPMVLRVPAFVDPEATDGHRAQENSLGVLRDVPGLVVAVPARPEDAAPMLRTCLASAAVDGSVCVVLEPAALYHTRDLLTEGDEGWLAPYLGPGAWSGGHVPVGRARGYGVGSAEDLTIITFGNGVRMSLRVAARLAEEGVGSRVVDLRWLSPLPVVDLVREASATGRVLVVDETRRAGGVGEGVLAALVDAGFVGSVRRVAAIEAFVPSGPAVRQVLLTEEAITQGARTLLAR